MRRLTATLSLFASSGTLVCCALPALFVTLGAGATFAGLISRFPQLVWLSEHKGPVFGAAGALLVAAGVLQRRARAMVCPPDPALAVGCRETRDLSRWIYGASVILFAAGAFFAFVLPRLP